MEFLQLSFLWNEGNLVVVKVMQHVLQAKVRLHACWWKVLRRLEWAPYFVVEETHKGGSTHACIHVSFIHGDVLEVECALVVEEVPRGGHSDSSAYCCHEFW